MCRHGHRCCQRANSQGKQLRGEEVLHGIPTQGPAESGQINHKDSSLRRSFFARIQCVAVNHAKFRYCGQERGDVDHRDRLECNSNEQRSFAADDVHQEERTPYGGDQFYNAEYCRDEKALAGPSDAKETEKIRGIEGNGAGSAL